MTSLRTVKGWLRFGKRLSALGPALLTVGNSGIDPALAARQDAVLKRRSRLARTSAGRHSRRALPSPRWSVHGRLPRLTLFVQSGGWQARRSPRRSTLGPDREGEQPARSSRSTSTSEAAGRWRGSPAFGATTAPRLGATKAPLRPPGRVRKCYAFPAGTPWRWIGGPFSLDNRWRP